MKLVLNRVACDGFGFCAEILPELIGLDEWGFPIIDQAVVDDSLAETAQEAIKSCPRKALLLLGTPEIRRHDVHVPIPVDFAPK